MKLPRSTRTTLIFSLCLIALASVLAYENHQLSLVSNNLASTADKDSLNALLTRLAKVDERLDAVDGKHLVTNDDFRSGQQALSNRIDTVQAYAKQATETTHDLSLRVTAAEEQVMVLKASIEMIDIRLQELSKPQASEPPVVAPPPKPVIRKKPPPAPQPPPFTVIGIEYRGGERFLSVAPPGSTQLSQINLIRPGDGVTGTAWKLKSMDGRLAHFEVAGLSRTLTVEP
ncbi:methyl-accepting chemotaxis protein [Pseudomonas fragi]|uniref:methyl-accepting chemotaxis protein n=1 Tax=Pseudomonas fragi TaxID=296 RepID=UPI001472BE70|nr:methyl-accepting chemotaxis protein [Pseudomonas fragi]NNB02990.1 methyl-accepting chemotaxis protein [Pseudomonas fragi]